MWDIPRLPLSSVCLSFFFFFLFSVFDLCWFSFVAKIAVFAGGFYISKWPVAAVCCVNLWCYVVVFLCWMTFQLHTGKLQGSWHCWWMFQSLVSFNMSGAPVDDAGTQGKENSGLLPPYLSDDEDEKHLHRESDKSALSRGGTEAESTASKWFSAAASFLTNSFYWWRHSLALFPFHPRHRARAQNSHWSMTTKTTSGPIELSLLLVNRTSNFYEKLEACPSQLTAQR